MPYKDLEKRRSYSAAYRKKHAPPPSLRYIDETGNRYGLLLVISKVANYKNSGSIKAQWLCRCDCGREVIIRGESLRKGTKSCRCLQKDVAAEMGKRCRGENHGQWKGGRIKTKKGYILVLNREHPKSRGGYVSEHALIMERFLGRPLTENETVHHKNGVKDDNRLENLELWASDHPPGQRVDDQVKWAKELLKKYSSPVFVDILKRRE